MDNSPVVLNCQALVSAIYPQRGYGFLIFVTESGRKIRVFFHFNDVLDGTAFEVGDTAAFDLSCDDQRRPKAINVKFISSAPASKEPRR